MTMNQRKTIELEEGWDFMEKGITKLKRILEGLQEVQFSSEEYMMLYTYPLSAIFLNLAFTFTHHQKKRREREREGKKISLCCHNLSLILIIVLYTTCAPKSRLMIILNSSTRNTKRLLKNTSIQW